MTLPAILYTLSAVPFFASRPFLAAFLTAALARWGTELPWIGDSAIVLALAGSPEWFRSTACVAVLGVLALLEVLAAKSPEVQHVLQQVDGVVKTAVSMLVALAVIDTDTARTLDAIQKAGFSLESLWAAVVGVLTFGAAALRRGVVELVTDADEGDDLGLVSLLAWSESSAAVLGILFLVVFPVAALVLAGLATVAVYAVRRAAERREQASKVPCAGCGTPIQPHATACHACKREVEHPRAVGVFGQPKASECADRARQGFELVSRKRCPVCATRLRERAVRQRCPTCGKDTFASPGELERYLVALNARLPRTLLVALVLGAVPLLGVVPGVVYYRLNLVAGLRGYIPPLQGWATRWLVRLVHVAVIALQPIPIVGAILLPCLAWSTYAIYRRSLATRARAELVPVRA